MGRGIYTVSFALLFLVPYIYGCSNLEYGARARDTYEQYETDEWKVHYTDVVVYGSYVETVNGNYPFKGLDGVETIKFKVLCTYKGGPNIPNHIYIAGIGNKNGKIKDCPPIPFSERDRIGDVIMFLKRTDKEDVFEIEFSPNIGEYETILDDISLVCGLKISNNSETICKDYPTLGMDEDCVVFDRTKIKLRTTEKPPPTPEPEPEEEQPETEPKEENNSDDTVVDIDAKEGKNNQSDEGYKTDPKNTNPDAARGSSDNGSSSSTIVTTSLLVTLITMFLTIVV